MPSGDATALTRLATDDLPAVAAMARAYLDIDLNARLIENPAATYLPPAPEDTGIDGIQPGDLLIVNRSLTPGTNRVVFAEVDGAYCIRRLLWDVRRGQWLLVDDAGFVPAMAVTERPYYHGTVTHSIRAHL